jgi:hypothetical protein
LCPQQPRRPAHGDRDYPAAAASLGQALELFRDIGGRHGQAETLNNLGELLTRSSASRPGPRTPHPGPGPRPGSRRTPGGGTGPGRNRPQLPPRRQPRPGRRTPAAGTGDLPAPPNPWRSAHPADPAPVANPTITTP